MTPGRKERRFPTKRSKSKGPVVREQENARLADLEQRLEDVRDEVGRLSVNMEEMVQENAEITVVAREMIDGIGLTFRSELNELSTMVANLKLLEENEIKGLKSTVDNLNKRVDNVQRELSFAPRHWKRCIYQWTSCCAIHIRHKGAKTRYL